MGRYSLHLKREVFKKYKKEENGKIDAPAKKIIKKLID